MRLSIELIPKSAFFQNARYGRPRSHWERVKLLTAADAGHKCEICHDIKGQCDRVEIHEIWNWQVTSETEGIQTLERTIALCPWCHRAKHWGHSEGTGLIVPTRNHMKRVNGWTDDELELHITGAWREWRRLSKITWTPEMSFLDSMLARAPRLSKSRPVAG